MSQGKRTTEYDGKSPQDILGSEEYFSRAPRKNADRADGSQSPSPVRTEDASFARPDARARLSTDADAPDAVPAGEDRPSAAPSKGAPAQDGADGGPADAPAKKKAAPIDLFSDDDADAAPAAGGGEFSFDRFGRRTSGKRGKKSRARKKAEYGKRADAQQARTLVVQKETAATREMQEAQKRAAFREEQRQKLLDQEQKLRRLEKSELAKKRMSVLFTLIIGAIVLAVVFYAAFIIHSIEVTGELTRYSPNDIVRISGLRTGRHILQLNLSDAEALLDADPYLDADVAYVFPNRIRITVSERKQAAAVRWGPNKEYMAVIDKDGIVLESDTSSYEGLLLVEGMVVTGAAEATRIGEVIDEQVSAMLSMINKLSEYGLTDKIAYLDMSETMSIGMYTAEGYRIEVGGVDNLDTKLTRLNKKWTEIMSAAARYQSEGSTTVTIYLYSKLGVTISPYAPDYVATTGATPESTTLPYASDGTQSTPDPNATPAPDTTDNPYQTVPTPSPTADPYHDDPFTG